MQANIPFLARQVNIPGALASYSGRKNIEELGIKFSTSVLGLRENESPIIIRASEL